MAFVSTFKPIFDTLSPTTHRDTIATPLVEAMSGPFRESLSTFPYTIPPNHRQFLCDAGINVTDFGTKTHPHPVHKTIELNLLRNVWRNYASAPSSVLFMKPSKFEKLKDLNPNFQELHNYRTTPKDTTRYPTTSPTLPSTPNVFMHDALMYYGQDQILDLFIRCPSLENLFTSLVVPPESDFTHLSLNPTLYRYQFKEDSLVYHLENNPAHSYTQPRSAISWLKTSMIIGENLQLSVTVLDSWGPVHSILIQRGLAPATPPLDTISFKVPDCILLPEANHIKQDPRHRLVPRSAFNLLFGYVRSVRTLRVTDPAGLIRTQSNKPEFNWVTSAAWDNLQHFALHTSPHRPISHYMLFKSPLQRLKHWAKTNEFFLFALTSIASTPLSSSAAFYLAHLSRCRIHHLSLFKRWVIAPPKPLNPFATLPPAPKFSLSLAIRQTPFLHSAFNHLFQKPRPNLPGFLQSWYRSHTPAKLPSCTPWLIISACVVPLAVLGYRWFSGPDTPQALHDQYQAYFHPDQWQLTFDRKPCYTDRKPFLTFEPVTPQKPIDAPSHPLSPSHTIDIPITSPSLPTPSTPPPKPPAKHVRISSPPVQPPPISITTSGPPPPDHFTTTQPPTPSTDHHTQTNPPTAEPDSSSTNPTPTEIIDPSTLEPVYTQATQPADFVPPTFSNPEPITLENLQPSELQAIADALPDAIVHDLDCQCPIHASSSTEEAFDFSGSDPHQIHDISSSQTPTHSQSQPPLAIQPPPRQSDAPLHPSAHPPEALLVYSEKHSAYINLNVANLPELYQHEINEIGFDFPSAPTNQAATHNFDRLLVFCSKFDTHIPLIGENFVHLTPEEISSITAPSQPATQSSAPTPPPSPTAQETDPSTLLPDSPRSTASVDSFGVLDYVETDPPTPYQPDDNSLLSDPTGMGEARAWELLHPKNYAEYSGAFVTRARNGPPASLPYPPTDCLLQALSKALSIQPTAFWQTICSELPDMTIDYPTILTQGLNTEHLTVLATMYDFLCTVVHDNREEHKYGLLDSKTNITICHSSGSPGHFYFPDAAPRLQGAKTSDLAHALLRHRTPQGELLPFQKVHHYRSVIPRAKNLISNMKNGFDGVMINVNPHEPSKAREAFLTLDGSIDHTRSKTVQLIHLAGFAGCGKSYPVQKLLATPMFKHYKVAVPTTELRSEWKEALQLKPKDNWRVSTWESSLLKSAKILVIDEIYRMPRGYLDLSIHADANLELVILLGDPLQGEYHSSNQSSSNHRLSSEVSHLSPYIDYYCLWSRRIPQDVAHFFGIESSNPEPGFHSFTNRFPNTQILGNSTNTASLLHQAGYSAITIASSQGSTYTCPCTINLDKHSRILSIQHSLIALTRSRKGNIFVGDRSLLKGDSSSNPLFSKYFNDETVDLFDLFRSHLQHLPILRQPLRSRTSKLSGAASRPLNPNLSEIFSTAPTFSNNQSHAPTPHTLPSNLLSRFISRSSADTSDVIYFANVFSGLGDLNSPQISTHFLPETRRPLHFDYSSAIASSASPTLSLLSTPITCTPVYPGENFETHAASFLPAHDPDLKEILWRDQSSCQFPYLSSTFTLGCQPLSLVAPVHSPKNDHTLLPASIEKRLRFRPTSSPYTISPKDEILGSILFESLCRAYHRDPDQSIPFNENLFLECINLNEYCQLSSKTQAVIMANYNRSDPDWRTSVVRIFAKSQHKVNESTLFSDWKACQTLALMHDAVILLLGPVKKYQRIFDAQDRPSNLYVHASHTPTDLSNWAKNHLTSSVHVANDYTAFDQSQHGEAVVLEIRKMRRLNIPEHLIQLHLELKTNVETQFGPLTCMRLTGEPGTYDDNTDYNIAVLYTEYAISNQGVAVSGDDSIIDSEPPTRVQWSFVRPLLALRFKKEFSRYGLFCGYYIGPEGACRSPLALFAKLCIALDDTSIDEKLVSYLAEFLIGHSLGQPMWNLIPMEQVLHQSANFDFFCRYTPSSLKPALQLGEPPASILHLLFPAIRFLTYPLWSMLNNTQRAIFHRSKVFKNQSSIQPFQPSPEGELLPKLNFNEFTDDITDLSAISDPSDIIRDLEDYHFQPDHVYLPKLASDNAHFKLSGASPMAQTSDLLAQILKLLQEHGSSSTSGSGSPQPSAAASLLLAAPHVMAPARSLTTPNATSPAGVTIPFQSLFYDITGTETKSTSISIASLNAITSMLPNYRYCKLVQLEAVISPTAHSQKYPQTIEVVWCTADQTIADDKIMQTYGSARYAFGGPVNMPVQTIHPADLAQLNPVLKDSITYSDTPRFCLRFWENADCKKLSITAPICGSIYLRGMIHLSSIAATPSAK